MSDWGLGLRDTASGVAIEVDGGSNIQSSRFNLISFCKASPDSALDVIFRLSAVGMSAARTYVMYSSKNFDDRRTKETKCALARHPS